MSAATLTPSVVSRTLRSAGFRPLPSGTPAYRDGLRVRRAGMVGTVSVWADYDFLHHRAQRLIADVAEVLTEAGLTVERSEQSEVRLYVTRPPIAEPEVQIDEDAVAHLHVTRPPVVEEES